MAEKKHRVHYDVTAKDGTRAAFDSVKKSLHDVDQAALGLKGSLAGLGIAVAAGAMLAAGKAAIDASDNLGKLSQRVGVSVETLSSLGYAAKLSDVSIEELGQGLKKLSVNMLDTQANTGDAKDAFKALGISVEASKGNLKSSEQVLLEIADKFAGMEDGAGKTALAVKLFGRAGADLIPLLNQGAEGLRNSAEEAKRFGLIISTEAAKKAEEFNDNITRVRESLRGFGIGIANEALPWLNKMIEQLLEGTRIAGGFAQALRLFGMSNITSSNAGSKIPELTAQIAELEKKRKSAWFSSSDAADLEGKRKQLEFAKFLQRQEALALGVAAGGNTAGEAARMRRSLERAPGLPGDGKDKNAEKRLREAERIARLQAEEEERWAKEASEAWNFVPKMQERLAEHVRLTSMLDDRAGGTVEDMQQRLKLMYEAIDALNDIEERGMRVYAGFNEEGTEYLGVVKETDDLWKDLGLTMSSAFEDAVLGGKNLRGVLQGIGQDIARIILRKGVTEPLGNAVIKSLGESSIGEFFKGLLPGRAAGGPVRRGMPYIVGEQGSELFVPSQSGTIIPHDRLGGGGAPVNVHFHYNLGLSPSIRAEVVSMMPQIRRDVIGAVHDARRRNVIA